MEVTGSHLVHLGCLPDDSGRRSVGKQRCLLEQWIEQIGGVELTEPVDAEMSIDPISVQAELVCIDTRAEN